MSASASVAGQDVQEPAASEAPVVVAAHGISKVYTIYDRPQDRLKQLLRPGRRYGREFWALRDVSFELRRGETVGIIGRNGSGKSTLLQILAGTLAPSTGSVEVSGRVAALLELGSGFNPEFSGRENVFLNGALLGIDRAEMARRFDAVAAFADIGDFIDQPVKIYSSGMLVRLAFAVQAHVDPEILIVDEALAVGDMYFQAKCMARVAELRRRGTSILLVSHSLPTVKALCTRCLLLDGGRLIMEGAPDPVGDRYASLVLSRRPDAPEAPPASAAPSVSTLHPAFESRITERFGTGAARYVECQIFQDGHETVAVSNGRKCEIHALLRHHERADEPGEVGIVVRSIDGLDLFAVNSFLLDRTYPAQPAGALVRLIFRFEVILAPGTYSVALGYRVPMQGQYVDKAFGALVFNVAASTDLPMPFLFSVPQAAFEFRPERP